MKPNTRAHVTVQTTNEMQRILLEPASADLRLFLKEGKRRIKIRRSSMAKSAAFSSVNAAQTTACI